jgi:hypothetical protein
MRSTIYKPFKIPTIYQPVTNQLLTIYQSFTIYHLPMVEMTIYQPLV